MKIHSVIFLSLLFPYAVAAQQEISSSHVAVQHLDYTRKVLFSIPVGSESQNVGVVWQPYESGQGKAACGLRVRGGRVYVGDHINGAVKVFTLQGRYLTRTRGIIHRLRNLCVNDKGEIFTLSGEAYDTVTKFSSSGQMMWGVKPGQELPEKSKDRSMPFLSINTAQGGGVGVGLWSGDSMALLDAKGRFQRIVPGNFVTEGSHTYSFTGGTSQRPLGGQMKVFDMNGKLLFYRQLQSDAKVKALFGDTIQYEEHPDRLGKGFVSPDGLPYTISNVNLPTHIVVRPDDQAQGYSTNWYVIVVTYSSSGQPLAALRFIAPPFSDYELPITMDEHDNVYTVEYIPNKVRLVRYKLQKAAKH